MFYVYIHKRASNGMPFYVGKGSGRRAWELSEGRRNDAWARVVRSRGVRVEIIQENMSEDDALLLEAWLIAKLRHEGHKLANLVDGGSGAHGMVPWWKKPIFSMDINGNITRYDSPTDAALAIGKAKSASGNISSSALGKKLSAYGFVWWYEGDEPKEYARPYDGTRLSLSKKVYNSVGEEFSSCSEAARQMNIKHATKATAGSISTCCLKGKRFLGIYWSYDPIIHQQNCEHQS